MRLTIRFMEAWVWLKVHTRVLLRIPSPPVLESVAAIREHFQDMPADKEMHEIWAILDRIERQGAGAEQP